MLTWLIYSLDEHLHASLEKCGVRLKVFILLNLFWTMLLYS